MIEDSARGAAARSDPRPFAEWRGTAAGGDGGRSHQPFLDAAGPLGNADSLQPRRLVDLMPAAPLAAMLVAPSLCRPARAGSRLRSLTRALHLAESPAALAAVLTDPDNEVWSRHWAAVAGRVANFGFPLRVPEAAAAARFVVVFAAFAEALEQAKRGALAPCRQALRRACWCAAEQHFARRWADGACAAVRIEAMLHQLNDLLHRPEAQRATVAACLYREGTALALVRAMVAAVGELGPDSRVDARVAVFVDHWGEMARAASLPRALREMAACSHAQVAMSARRGWDAAVARLLGAAPVDAGLAPFPPPPAPSPDLAFTGAAPSWLRPAPSTEGPGAAGPRQAEG